MPKIKKKVVFSKLYSIKFIDNTLNFMNLTNFVVFFLRDLMFASFEIGDPTKNISLIKKLFVLLWQKSPKAHKNLNFNLVSIKLNDESPKHLSPLKNQ